VIPGGRILHRLTRLGVTSETPPADAKYIILTNSVGCVGILVGVFYLFVNSTAQSRVAPIWPSVLNIAVYLFPLWLNHRGRHWLATTVLVVAGMATQVAFVLVFGYASGNHFFFLPMVAGISLIYPPKYWATAIFFVVVALVAFVAIVLSGDAIQPLLPNLDPRGAHTYYVLALLISAVIIAFVTLYSHRQNVLAERRVEQRTQELARALEDLKQAQARMIESENQAVLGRLAAGLLHEMNTPLGSMRSAANTIRRAVDQSRDFVLGLSESKRAESQAAIRSMEVSSDLCRSLESSTERIRNVVEGLEDFVALDAAERMPFDVRKGLDSTLTLLGASLGDRIEVVREYPKTLPKVLCFPGRLNQAFLCIFQNAIQAIDGEGEIRVRVRENDGGVKIEIVDNGRGIPASVMPEIFQLGLAQKRGRVGLRLGLAMSKRTVEELGGRLALESIEGRGTTAHIALPIGGYS